MHSCTHTVIEALGSTGSGQFGTLGVSWSKNAQVPDLTHTPPPHHDDDLGTATSLTLCSSNMYVCMYVVDNAFV